MAVQTYDLSSVVNDTWGGLAVQVNVNGAACNLTGCSIEMDVRQYASTPAIAVYTTSNGGITITVPANGNFQVNPAIISAPAGAYNYQIQITFLDGSVRTWLMGRFTLMDDYVHG